MQVLLELVGERVQLQQLRGVGVLLGDRGGLAQELEVERDLLDDPGPAHLDDDLAAALQERAVDLARSMPLASGSSSIEAKCSRPMSSAIASRSGANGSGVTSSTRRSSSSM